MARGCLLEFLEAVATVGFLLDTDDDDGFLAVILRLVGLYVVASSSSSSANESSALNDGARSLFGKVGIINPSLSYDCKQVSQLFFSIWILSRTILCTGLVTSLVIVVVIF